ncbi:MAG: hypothetical protein QXS41_00560 [Candidatus Woesearchaeota archaeon]
MKKIIFYSILLMLFLFNSCIQVTVYQKIYSDGKTDIDYSIIADSEESYSSNKKNINQKNEIVDEIKQKLKITETNKSITYKFSNLKLNQDKKIFKDQNHPLNLENMKLEILEESIFQKKYKFSAKFYFTKDKNNQVPVNYTVEVEGKISETNGKKINDNKVNFNFDGKKDEEIYVIFEKEKISLGAIFIFIFPLFALIILFIGIIIISKKSKKQNQTTNSEQVNQNLINYIYNAKSLGWNDDQIMQALLNAGWKREDIKKGFKYVKKYYRK